MCSPSTGARFEAFRGEPHAVGAGPAPEVQDRARREDLDPRPHCFTEREREILALVTTKMTNRQIGEELLLAEETVKIYVPALTSRTRTCSSPSGRPGGPVMIVRPRELP